MKIILTGYRASGKTTVGKLLALLMKVPFYDSDHLVEEIAGAPIKNIVAHQGWEYFRNQETEVLRQLSAKGDCVIATGGGAILAATNVEILKNTGLLIWLNAPINEIVGRLKTDAQNDATRPPFTDEDIEQETIMIREERLPVYQKTADIIVNTAGKTAAQIAEEIYHRLQKTKERSQETEKKVNSKLMSS